jgi:outer membrane protein OmpA-like peptidoglycan-associated protein
MEFENSEFVMKKVRVLAVYAGFVLASWLCVGLVRAQTELVPTETQVLLRLTLQHMDGRMRPNEIMEFRDTKGSKKLATADAQGQIQLLLPKGETYIPHYLAYNKWISSESELVTPTKPGLLTLSLTLQFDYELTEGQTIELKNTLFETGSATLKPTHTSELGLLADFLKAQKQFRLRIEGHTDNVGRAEDNLKLSQARADAVKQFLVRKGVEAHRLETKGWGDTKPVADNATPEGRAQNRRTEISEIK